jgi:hypothetical protein
LSCFTTNPTGFGLATSSTLDPYPPSKDFINTINTKARFRRHSECPRVTSPRRILKGERKIERGGDGNKTRGDEPVVSGAWDRSASLHKNCLPVIASASNQSRHHSVTVPSDSTVKAPKLFPCQITPYPTCHFPRNNAPLNLPCSHENPWRGTIL